MHAPIQAQARLKAFPKAYLRKREVLAHSRGWRRRLPVPRRGMAHIGYRASGIAMGGTEEAQRVAALGVDARGSESDGHHNRFNGDGHVKSSRDKAQYASALSMGHGVTLIATELGRDHARFDNTLHHYGKLAAAEGTTDSTVYGASRASTRSYYQHHLAAIRPRHRLRRRRRPSTIHVHPREGRAPLPQW